MVTLSLRHCHALAENRSHSPGDERRLGILRMCAKGSLVGQSKNCSRCHLQRKRATTPSSLIAQTDVNGVVQNRITYNGFGLVINQTNAAFSDRWLFTGREMDLVTLLQYNRNRYYDLTARRWLTIDPIGFLAGDTNLNRYVGNNATNLIDPSGFAGWDPEDTYKLLENSTPELRGYKDKWLSLKSEGWKLATDDNGGTRKDFFTSDNINVEVTKAVVERVGYQNAVRNQYAVDFATKTIYIDAYYDSSAAEFFRESVDIVWKGYESRLPTQKIKLQRPPSITLAANDPGWRHRADFATCQMNYVVGSAVFIGGFAFNGPHDVVFNFLIKKGVKVARSTTGKIVGLFRNSKRVPDSEVAKLASEFAEEQARKQGRHQIGVREHLDLQDARKALNNHIHDVHTNPLNAPKLVPGSLRYGKNAEGHLVKHRDALGFGHLTAQEAQQYIPQLKAEANKLLKSINPDLTRVGAFHGHKNAKFYISNGRMIITEADGTLISIVETTSSNWYQKAVKP